MNSDEPGRDSEATDHGLDAEAEALRQRAEQLRHTEALPDVPTEAEIEARIRAATGGRDLTDFRRSVERAQRSGRDAPESGSKSDYRGQALGLHAAYVLLGFPMAGAGLGWLLDRSLGSTWGVGVGTLAMAVLALVYVITILNRENRR